MNRWSAMCSNISNGNIDAKPSWFPETELVAFADTFFEDIVNDHVQK
jgi:hypothetical protein